MPRAHLEKEEPAEMFQKTALKIAFFFVLQICSTLEDCSLPGRISNGGVTYESTNLNSVARYYCDPGYMLNGPSSRKCGYFGWSGKPPKCIPKSCGSPGDILNGWYEASDNVFGARATFHCDEGFKMIGKNYRMCEPEGWSGQVPTCEPVKCVDLPPIKNGKTPPPSNGEFWEYGALAKFSCLGDYSLIGAEMIYCLASGNWSHDPPTCRDVRCTKPPTPKNSRSISKPAYFFKYGETIVYECDAGFGMMGSGVIKCTENSEFQPAPPTCNLTGCYRPEHIVNGRIVNEKPVYTQHETVRYICRDGYKLTGSETLSCKGNDTFDHHPPSCNSITCRLPAHLPNGYIKPYKAFYRYGDHLSFGCNPGYKLVGNRESVCVGEDNFSNPLPTCKKVYCNVPRNLHNTNIAPCKPIYNHGDQLSFSCHPGYKLVGNRESVCIGEDNFSHPPPTCKKETSPWIIPSSTYERIKDIIQQSYNIIEEQTHIIQMENQLHEREGNILLRYRELLQRIELLVSRPSMTKPS
ncbi:sushi, von Willebrand factor type A, EGF and pentraxin domain-containing protein 1-like [Pristis pectinata]|uniref:sushi, von Willebrand factor type A, EGF and pentraxin domain-containing protein 1-like n=1 Tax=Pristis pectinata TaxID=685728 RepID=UPI00223CAA61|nr:sushi, von Willebrand factor type A, EGF and pentraxin domain-containing protein 1-like [Pristis pectinata]